MLRPAFSILLWKLHFVLLYVKIRFRRPWRLPGGQQNPSRSFCRNRFICPIITRRLRSLFFRILNSHSWYKGHNAFNSSPTFSLKKDIKPFNLIAHLTGARSNNTSDKCGLYINFPFWWTGEK